MQSKKGKKDASSERVEDRAAGAVGVGGEAAEMCCLKPSVWRSVHGDSAARLGCGAVVVGVGVIVVRCGNSESPILIVFAGREVEEGILDARDDRGVGETALRWALPHDGGDGFVGGLPGVVPRVNGREGHAAVRGLGSAMRIGEDKELVEGGDDRLPPDLRGRDAVLVLASDSQPVAEDLPADPS